MDSTETDIREIVQRSGDAGGVGVYKVLRGMKHDFSVVANDMLGAYTTALAVEAEEKEEDEMHTRWITVAVTTCVLGALTAITYSCSSPKAMDRCIAAGKKYVEYQGQGSNGTSIVACQ